LLLLSIKFYGQTTEKSRFNALSFEVGKTGLIYSLSFDRRFRNNFGLRIIAGTNFSSYLKAFSTFCGGYYLFEKDNNAFELGIDIGYLSVDQIGRSQRNLAFIFPDYSIKTYYTNLNIGYRKYMNKHLFRIGAAPGYSKSGPLPGAYISYGITF